MTLRVKGVPNIWKRCWGNKHMPRLKKCMVTLWWLQSYKIKASPVFCSPNIPFSVAFTSYLFGIYCSIYSLKFFSKTLYTIYIHIYSKHLTKTFFGNIAYWIFWTWILNKNKFTCYKLYIYTIELMYHICLFQKRNV